VVPSMLADPPPACANRSPTCCFFAAGQHHIGAGAARRCPVGTGEHRPTMAWVPQMRVWHGARICGLTCANACRGGDGACH
jgi:hypothetical protein